MKTKTKITIGFAAEIVFFVSVGGFTANRMFPSAIVSLIFAMFFAGYVGKLIEKDAIEKYEDKKVLEFAEKLEKEK